jgi:DNA-binding NarL/FixJ family response regulator
MPPITLVLADDHPIVLRGLCELFGSDGGFKVLGTCRDGEEAVSAVRTFRPDVLLLDLRLPAKDGLAVLRALRTDDLKTRAVLVTAFVDERAVAEAMRLGVAGIVLKDSNPSVLIDCVRRVRCGGTWFDPDLLAATLQHTLQRDEGMRQVSATLTPREVEIVRMVAEGLRNREIAERLQISDGTVKIHLHNIYTKLEIDGRVDLVRYAQQFHLL